MTHPSSARLVSRRPGSRRAQVNEHQARCLAMLIRNLERGLVDQFRVRDVHALPPDRFADIWDLPQYRMFIEGAHACGFVCRDFSLDGPWLKPEDQPSATIPGWDFPELRHYVHMLVRGERWSDRYSSPIFEAIASGALGLVARQLEENEALYEPL